MLTPGKAEKNGVRKKFKFYLSNLLGIQKSKLDLIYCS